MSRNKETVQQITKTFASLNEADLQMCAVWRYDGGSDDSAWVEPERRSQLSVRDNETFVVSTTFRLADGSELPGVCSPVDPAGLANLQPVIFSNGRHVSLWAEPDGGVEVRGICEGLGKSPLQVFPIEFHCHVPVDEERVSGIITLKEALPNPTLQLKVTVFPCGQPSTEKSS